MIDEALEHLVKGIVDNPAEVVITEKSSRGGTTLEVRVHPEDIGQYLLGEHELQELFHRVNFSQ